MSKWKEKTISITQIQWTSNSYIPVIGLGSDDMLYVWNRSEGAWEKYWIETDKPK